MPVTRKKRKTSKDRSKKAFNYVMSTFALHVVIFSLFHVATENYDEVKDVAAAAIPAIEVSEPAMVFGMEREDCLDGEKYNKRFELCLPEVQKEVTNEDDLWEEVRGLEYGAPYEEHVIATYDVADGGVSKIGTTNHHSSVPAFAEEDGLHRLLWTFFVFLTPQHYVDRVGQFVVSTDGVDGSIAYVEIDDVTKKWIVSIDPQDVFDEAYTLVNIDDFFHTLIHEFAHIITLDESQVAWDDALLVLDENSSDRLIDLAFNAALLRCGDDRYLTQEGCTYERSYLNEFYFRFWDPIAEEIYPTLEAETDDFGEVLDELYDDYYDQFVSAYAITNPGEDIAEVFVHFVLGSKPDGNDIWEQKILFMYEKPELVALRDFVRARVALLQSVME